MIDSSEMGAARPRQRPEAPGLVNKVTTRTVTRYGTNEIRRKEVYRSLNRERRVRRMRRVVVCSANASRQAVERHGNRHYAVFVTLTYRPGVLWSQGQVSAFIQRYSKWCARRGVVGRYQWVLELTRAGAPHYHVLLWLPKRLRVPKPDKSGWWSHGLSRIELAYRPVGYLVKYASKGFGGEGAGEIPRGARLFGCGNGKEERHEVRRARLPVWLAERTEDFQLPRRVPYRGFVCPQTEKVYRSPYRLDVVRDLDGRFVVIVEERNVTGSNPFYDDYQ